MKKLTLFAMGVMVAACHSGSFPADQPEPTRPDPEEASVIAAVEVFFETLTTGDRSAAEAVLLPEGLFHAVRQSPDGWALGQRTHQAHLEALGTGPDEWVERMWEPTVLVHERIAVLWTPYDFHVNGEFSHCGVDAFSLVKLDDTWKIAGVMYTTEPSDCEPSPLGPLSGVE
jgi:hypothetical protein